MDQITVKALTGLLGVLGLQLATIGVAGAAAPAREACTREQEAANKKVIESLRMPTPEGYLALMDDTYLQHNPDSARFAEINHLEGKEAMVKLLEGMHKVGYQPGRPRSPDGKPPAPPPAPVLVAECDLVFALQTHEEPDPMHPGKTYTAFGFDLYRVRNGKLMEHWDAARIENPWPAYLDAPLKDLKPRAGAPVSNR